MTDHHSTILSPWGSDDEPFEPVIDEAQREAILYLHQEDSRTILDLGSGAGRLTIPLAEAGHTLHAVDLRPDALELCRSRLSPDALSRLTTTCTSVFDLDWPTNTYDTILCLGNTLMTMVNLMEVQRLFDHITHALKPTGQFIIDDLPALHWPELTEGNWQNGISEDGKLQLIWDEREPILALRADNQVDDQHWSFKPEDHPYRFYTADTLTLLARAAGLSDPKPLLGAPILGMNPLNSD